MEGQKKAPRPKQGPKDPPPQSYGLSLVELLVIIVILSILTAIAIPSFLNLMQRYRLLTTIQTFYYQLQYARSEAIKRNVDVYVSIQTGSAWCYGLNTGSSCNCSTPSACNLGAFTPPNSGLTTLSLNSGFSGFYFESSRGTASSAGKITLTITGGTTSMGLNIGTVGNLQICSSTVSGYPSC